MPAKKNKSGPNQNNYLKMHEDGSWIKLLPLIMLITIMPFIVKVKAIELSENAALYWTGTNVNFDFFSYYKSMFIIFAAVLCLIFFFIYSKKNISYNIKNNRVLYISLFIYTSAIMISSLMSEHTWTALFGGPDRYEGAFVLLSYILISIYILNIHISTSHIKILAYCLYFTVFVMGILGILQYAGKDFFATELARDMMFSGALERFQNTLSIKDMGRSIYGTFTHYNYMGSFGALLFPFSATMALMTKDKALRITSAASAAVSLFLLLASSARSGIVGVVIALIVMVVIFRDSLMHNLKYAALFLVAVVIFVTGLNIATGGQILSRMSLFSSDVSSFLSNEQTDYRQEVPLKAVEVKEGKVYIQTSEERLSAESKNSSIRFYDEDNNPVKYNIRVTDETTSSLIIEDERYADFDIKTIMNQAANEQYLVINKGVINLIFLTDKNELIPTNPNGAKVDLQEAEAIGFKGKETLGSGRGYIWSRTFPLLKNAVIAGFGPDTFFMEFPQDDIYAKAYVYQEMWHIVDKPHNMYIQIAFSTGIISLLAFLTYVFIFAAKSFEYIRIKRDSALDSSFIAASLTAIAGYLGAAVFNDSIVGIAPLFWILTAFSMSLFKPEKE